jgi:hypothetical protein
VPWIAGALVVAAIGGAVAFFQPKESPPALPPSAPAPVVDVTKQVPATSTEAAAPRTKETEAQTPAAVAPRPTASSGDLGEQIALLDSARAAMAANKGERALELLSRYLAKYPSGSFRPEAKALRIETLSKLGRKAESRALAERFVAEHEGSPLSKRVKDFAEPSR